MFNWLFSRAQAPRRNVSDVAREIADEFKTGKIVSQDLGAYEINGISVSYLGKTILAEWYPQGMNRSLEIDGAAYPAESDSADVDHIMDAAKQRAKHLLSERFAELDALRVTT